MQPSFSLPTGRWKALALIHLLDVIDGLGVFAALRTLDQHGPEVVQRQTGTIIEQISSAAQDAGFPFEMALLADGVAELGRQASGIDNVPAIGGADVQLARPMTALAADGLALEHRRHEAVRLVGMLVETIGMAEQTGGRHQASRQDHWPKPRRQIPTLLRA